MGLQALTEYFQIHNGRLKARVNTRGAELVSLFDVERGRELLWQGDSAIWAGTAPILFPVVGRLREGGFCYRDRFYPMAIHGFAAASDFVLESISPATITLCLLDNEHSRALYPFEFALRVHFRLTGHALRVEYEVHNPSGDPLIFSLGSHPAFALPAKTMEEASAEVRFDQSEKDACHRIRNGLLGSEEVWPILENRLSLSADTFDEDAIILRNLRSRNVTLYAHGERLLTLDTGGAPHLGLWAKPNAPYLCIEPWLTTDDSAETPLAIAEKPGFISLGAGENFRAHYRVLI